MRHVRDCLSAPALPFVLAQRQARAGFGEFSPPAPDQRPPTTNPQAQPPGVGSVPLADAQKRVARLESSFDNLPSRNGHRLATSRLQAVLALEVPASAGATRKGRSLDSAYPADVVGQYSGEGALPKIRVLTS